MIMTILHSVLYKKQNVTGYIQYYQKMVGQTQRHTEPQFLSDLMSDRKKKFWPSGGST